MDSYMFQTIAHSAIPLYEECLAHAGVPLFREPITGRPVQTAMDYAAATEADEVEDLFRLLSRVKDAIPSLQAVCSGAILSDYQRLRVENVCRRLDLVPLAPLWALPQAALVPRMIAAPLDAVLVKVAAMGLVPRRHLGMTLSAIWPTLMRLGDMYGLNVAGEGGEYETLVLDAPFFSRRIVLAETAVEYDDGNPDVAHLRILRAHTEPKEQGTFWPAADQAPGPGVLQRPASPHWPLADPATAAACPAIAAELGYLCALPGPGLGAVALRDRPSEAPACAPAAWPSPGVAALPAWLASSSPRVIRGRGFAVATGLDSGPVPGAGPAGESAAERLVARAAALLAEAGLDLAHSARWTLHTWLPEGGSACSAARQAFHRDVTRLVAAIPGSPSPPAVGFLPPMPLAGLGPDAGPVFGLHVLLVTDRSVSRDALSAGSLSYWLPPAPAGASLASVIRPDTSVGPESGPGARGLAVASALEARLPHTGQPAACHCPGFRFALVARHAALLADRLCDLWPGAFARRTPVCADFACWPATSQVLAAHAAGCAHALAHALLPGSHSPDRPGGDSSAYDQDEEDEDAPAPPGRSFGHLLAGTAFHLAGLLTDTQAALCRAIWTGAFADRGIAAPPAVVCAGAGADFLDACHPVFAGLPAGPPAASPTWSPADDGQRLLPAGAGLWLHRGPSSVVLSLAAEGPALPSLEDALRAVARAFGHLAAADRLSVIDSTWHLAREGLPLEEEGAWAAGLGGSPLEHGTRAVASQIHLLADGAPAWLRLSDPPAQADRHVPDALPAGHRPLLVCTVLVEERLP
ncbi:hypothetical protein H696_05455 [Fonticula alba]|uniref:Diphthine--ammonia ligase n=1 Tax=Fonticula alba TaxID=691883 RepID=A0A058Z162_FONAL|nr:hypothetical protein H696_05455 [Fonticula alba]KCV67989.1 hypothetical protein H696_05455 [Fonticula alba]|eukprot:XP_009497556.1 hypothetical protein H696_05455 [Fonticula alba]